MYFELRQARCYAFGQVTDPTQPTIIFLHGAAMDHSVWVYHARYFRFHGANVLALDLPRHGRAEGEALTSIEAMAEWVIEVIDHLGLEHVSLCGHSMGGLVALEVASRLGDRAERVALLGVAFPMAVSDVLLDAARANERSAVDMMTIWGHGARAQLGGNAVAGISVMATAERLLERAEPGLMFNDLNACNEYQRGAEAAARISAKTTFICGEEDKMTPARAAQKLAQNCRDGAVELVRSSGHILMSEQPEMTHKALVRALL
ncbi:MAG: alpha/beta fold hydrolase [Gammaproteobacteria bacterium]